MQHMLRISLTAFLLVIATPPAIAAGDKAKFESAYQAYQELVAKGHFYPALPHAKTAFEEGRKIYGKKSEEAAVIGRLYGQLLMRPSGGSR